MNTYKAYLFIHVVKYLPSTPGLGKSQQIKHVTDYWIRQKSIRLLLQNTTMIKRVGGTPQLSKQYSLYQLILFTVVIPTTGAPPPEPVAGMASTTTALPLDQLFPHLDEDLDGV